jgi:hypothetical protein
MRPESGRLKKGWEEGEMALHTALARPQFGSLEHLRRPGSVMDRIGDRQHKYLRLKARQFVDRVKPKTDELKDVAVIAATSSAVSFGFGFLHGRLDPQKMMVGPIPIDLLVGVGASLASVTAMAGEASPYLRAAGIGALNAFASTFGRGLGRKARKSAGLPPVAETSMSGEEPAGRGTGATTGGGALSDEELARVARRT